MSKQEYECLSKEELINELLKLEKKKVDFVEKLKRSGELYDKQYKELTELYERTNKLLNENAELKDQNKELIRQLQVAEDDVQDLENEEDGFIHYGKSGDDDEDGE